MMPRFRLVVAAVIEVGSIANPTPVNPLVISRRRFIMVQVVAVIGAPCVRAAWPIDPMQTTDLLFVVVTESVSSRLSYA